MFIGHEVKQPNEDYTISADFNPDLLEGETITSFTVSSRLEVDDSDTTSDLLDPDPFELDGVIAQELIGTQEEGEIHVVTFAVTTSLRPMIEREIRVII